jgi:hypothetical protein
LILLFEKEQNRVVNITENVLVILQKKINFLHVVVSFEDFFDETETSRPSSKLFLQPSSTTGTKQEKRFLRGRGTKQRRKIQDSKQPNENIRVRQLRRRVQRQVYRPVWRLSTSSWWFCLAW